MQGHGRNDDARTWGWGDGGMCKKTGWEGEKEGGTGQTAERVASQNAFNLDGEIMSMLGERKSEADTF